jgi:hypothetical protein
MREAEVTRHMLGFWIALCVVVAGVLATMAFYALKAWDQDRSSTTEAMNPLAPPRNLDGHAKGRSDGPVRTTRAGRRAR